MLLRLGESAARTVESSVDGEGIDIMDALFENSVMLGVSTTEAGGNKAGVEEEDKCWNVFFLRFLRIHKKNATIKGAIITIVMTAPMMAVVWESIAVLEEVLEDELSFELGDDNEDDIMGAFCRADAFDTTGIDADA